MVRRWSSTVPGTDNLPWTKRRIVEYLSIGGLGAKIVGSPTTVADELERRGIYTKKVEKEGATAREVIFGSSRLPEDHPGSKYKWRAGEKIPTYQLGGEGSGDNVRKDVANEDKRKQTMVCNKLSGKFVRTKTP
jgi:hypothetical protein